MKRFALILIPLMLSVLLMACDFSGENTDSSAGTENSSSEASKNPSENTSITVSDTVSPDGKTEIKIAGIPVILKGIDELKNAGYTADSSFNMTVDVVLKGEKDVVTALTTADIVASVDVSGARETGEAEFMIDYSNPEGTEIVSTSESFAKVKIDKFSANVEPPHNDEAYIANGIIISGTRAMEQFGGSEKAGRLTAEKLNAFKKAFGDSINLYVLPAPLASAFYAPSKYPNSIKNHKNCFEGLRDALVDVGYVDTLSALAAHTDEEIYTRTDHHWHALGAYYAAEAFAQTAGVPFANISTFKRDSFDGYVGTMYHYSKADVIKNNPETFTWYIPTSEYNLTYYSRDKFDNPVAGELFASSKSYSKFIFGDSYTTDIQSNVGNGRKLLLFKDSYGNALAPFLISSFDEVIIADFRYFDVNVQNFIKEHGITDVCFELCSFAVAGNSRNYITGLLDK